MVFVGEKKYACDTCIKGHRSSSCKHTDRPLFEIKKKGRPVTQCDHCRELRKTKQVHVKCLCESKDDGEGLSPSTKKKSGKKAVTIPAFPSGLPETLEASVALQLLSEGSDSDRGSTGSSPACSCKFTGVCTCCTPRNATSRNKRQGKDHVSSHSAEDITSQPERDFRTQITRPAGLVVVANSGEFRPVLPRPQPQPSPPSVHGNPEAPHVSSGRQAVMYSPYGRAYEQTRGVEVTSPEPLLPSVFTTPSPIPEPAPQSPVPQSDPDATAWWASMASFPPSQIAATTCGCGSGCGCPNCLVHHPDPNNVNAPSNCSNPGTCNTCLDCTILSLPSSIPPDTPLSRYEASQYPSIDDWIQQVSSLTSQTNGSIGPSLSQLPPPPAPTEQDVRFNPSSWQTYALYSSLQAQGLARSAPQECCGGRCGCPSGMCVCSADCCGCCQGCSCSDCDRMNVTGGGGGGGKTLTFAVSGERGSCCGSTKSDSDRRSPLAGTGNGGSASGYRPVANNSFLGPATWDNSYLGVPRAFDSGASSSSRSSSPHSHSSCGSSNRSDGTRQQLDLVSGGGGGGGGGGDVQSCCAAMRVMDAPSSSRSASHSVSRAPAVYYAPPLDPPPPFSGVSAPQRTLTDFDYDSAMMFN